MTVGERIQMHRKQSGMSQEELGQKLHVSRQTISLWEKDQTVPTLDNLVRLREVFNITVDDILGFEEKQRALEPVPNEIYRFNYSRKELSEIQRLQRKGLYKKPAIFGAIVSLLIVSVVWYAPPILIGVLAGVFYGNIVFAVKNIRAYNKAWENSIEKVSQSVYEYKIFEDHINISIYRDNEKVRGSKCRFADIEKIQQLDRWLLLQFGGQMYILQKEGLVENSSIYLHMYKNPQKIKENPASSKWRVWSVVLFIASILSVLGGLFLGAFMSMMNDLFTENMWVFYLMTPIPIASVILGFKLKSKGYKYKKNIAVGIIMTIILCIYGSFTFMFSTIYDDSDTMIIKTEQTVGIDIPQHKQIRTLDLTEGTQTSARGYIYTTSYINFEDNAVQKFKRELDSDERWLSSVPNELIGVISPSYVQSEFDYVLIYNTDTCEFNTLPDNSGTYQFFNVFYDTENNKMKIDVYDIDYVK